MHTLLEQINQGRIWSFAGGIHPPERKALSNTTAIQPLPLADTFWVPVRQHIGDPGRLLVKTGDRVLTGQPLTQAMHAFAVPVHAPTSGTIGRIEPRVIAHSSGLTELCIEICADGQDQWREQHPLTDITTLDHSLIRARIRDAGIVGLGGAAFPAMIKLSPKKAVEYLLINGAECEPYISADDRLIREQAEAILTGIDLLVQLLTPKCVLFAIEDNKPEAIAALNAALKAKPRELISVRVIPTKYPSGSEKQLIKILTNQEVPKGQLPADLGMLMHNVGTCFAIKQAVVDDKPLIERVVTVTGEQAGKAGNYWVRIGTEVSWLMQHTQSKPLPQQPLIMGGPMMGFALPSQHVPIVKGSNCFLLPSLAELPPTPKARNCIRCGECAQVCPQRLLPQQLLWHSQAGEYDKAASLNLLDCIECGACAFVCPSDIPLVHQYRIAKAHLRENSQKAMKAEEAKLRFDARQARLEKEKSERSSRPTSSPARIFTAPNAANVSAGVEAALARIKAQKATLGAEVEVDMAELRRQRKEQARAAKAEQTHGVTQQAEPAATATKGADHTDNTGNADPKKAAVAAAIAKAKAKQAAAQVNQPEAETPAPTSALTSVQSSSKPNAEPDPDRRKAAVAAAIAKAKAKQAAAQVNQPEAETPAPTSALTSVQSGSKPNAEPKPDPERRKAAVAAAIAKAKAKQAAAQNQANNGITANSSINGARDDANVQHTASKITDATERTTEPNAEPVDPRQAAIARAIAKAKAKQQQSQ